jgi:SAM-dependent methyltransferase
VTDLRTPPISDGDLFSERVRQYADRRTQPVRVLEAGCGWGGGLALGDLDRTVTGVDEDVPELRAHTRARGDLDAWHLGDLRTVPLPPRAYDVVYAPYLIERVPCAELVLDRFVAALKPGGLLLVRLRDRDTAYGRLDRVTPQWARRRDAQSGGLPPALYEQVASQRGMRWYCMMRGLVIAEEYVSDELPGTARGQGTAHGPFAGSRRLVAAASGGRLTADHCSVALVIRKPENRFARVI